MTESSTLTATTPEKFTVGEWVDFRQRVGIGLWEGRIARVTRVNGLEVYVNIDGDPREPMAFFPRRSDGKHVRMLSKNGSVPDYEFAPTWIYHGKTAELFARAADKVAAEKLATVEDKRAFRLWALNSLKDMILRR